MVTEKDKKIEENGRMAEKREQRIFARILGLFLVLYGFLVLSQPSQYGLGVPQNLAPILGIALVIAGIFIVLRR